MPSQVEITIQQTTLVLFPQRAVFSSEHNTLFVADTHLGKDATFRRGGVPVPLGSTESTLFQVSELLDQTKAAELVILGDMFHAKSSLSLETRRVVEAFLEKHANVVMILVHGNHDRHVGPLPNHWPIECVPPIARMGSLALGHEPLDVPMDASVLLCGHLHPGIKLAARGESAGRLPCFWLTENRLVLPAMGDFTGLHIIDPTPQDRIWAIADNEVFAL